MFLNENILNGISLQLVSEGAVDNKPAVVQTITWHKWMRSHYLDQQQPSLPTLKTITRPWWDDIKRGVSQYQLKISTEFRWTNLQEYQLFLQWSTCITISRGGLIYLGPYIWSSLCMQMAQHPLVLSRPSAGTVMTKKLGMFFSEVSDHLDFQITFYIQKIHFQNELKFSTLQ